MTPFPTCLCTDARTCVACPLAHPCVRCGAVPGQRCRRPSGHTGPFVETHEDRLVLSDADAIATDPGEVRARLLTQRDEGAPAIAAWTRALRNLAATPAAWEGRISRRALDDLLELAEHGQVRGEQMLLGVDVDPAGAPWTAECAVIRASVQ